MTIEYILVGFLVLLSVLNLIIYKGKRNLVLIIISLVISLLYVPFVFVDLIKEFVMYYDILVLALIVVDSILFVSKKITKNITEYDYFELENSYKELEDDREKLRERYLSTISLIEEGVVFYENGSKDVILSDKAHIMFGGEQSLSLEEHALSIEEYDREEYLRTISRATKTNPVYSIQYRIKREEELFWVLERGHYIGVDSKKSIIATVIPQDVKLHKPSTYFDIDSLLDESKMYPVAKSYLDNEKSFYFIAFELSNIPELNKIYGRDMGSLMMSEYLKMIKREFTTNINQLFRVSGIKYVLLLDNEELYNKFHDYLLNSNSILYKTKVQVSAVKETVNANFSVIKLSSEYKTNVMDVYNLSLDILDETISSKRRNYTIHNE